LINRAKFIDRQSGSVRLMYTEDHGRLLFRYRKTIFSMIESLKARFLGEHHLYGDLSPALVETDGLIGVSLIHNYRNGYTRKSRFQIKIRGNFYFLKWQSSQGGNSYWHNPIIEALSTLKAEKIISYLPWAETISPCLAYSDSLNHFFASPWLEMPLLSDALIAPIELNKKLIGRYVELLELLREGPFNFREFHTGHIFYDEYGDKLILFDLHEDRAL